MWYLHHLRNWGSAGRRYSVLSRRAIWLQYKWKEEGRFLDIDRRIEKTLNIVGEEVWSEIDMGCCIVGIDYPIRRIWFWLWQIQKLHIWKTHKTDLKWWGKRSEWIRRRNSGGNWNEQKRLEELYGPDIKAETCAMELEFLKNSCGTAWVSEWVSAWVSKEGCQKYGKGQWSWWIGVYAGFTRFQYGAEPTLGQVFRDPAFLHQTSFPPWHKSRERNYQCPLGALIISLPHVFPPHMWVLVFYIFLVIWSKQR